MNSAGWKTSILPFRGLTVVFLILIILCFLQGTCNGEHHKARDHNKEATTCAVCDSQRNEDCSSNGTKFAMTCPKTSMTWCYKAEGKIETMDKEGHNEVVQKVQRGCTKARVAETCMRVNQEDGTDFQICFCEKAMCNIELKINATDDSDNGGRRFTVGLWTLSLSLFLYISLNVHALQ